MYHQAISPTTNLGYHSTLIFSRRAIIRIPRARTSPSNAGGISIVISVNMVAEHLVFLCSLAPGLLFLITYLIIIVQASDPIVKWAKTAGYYKLYIRPVSWF